MGSVEGEGKGDENMSEWDGQGGTDGVGEQ